MPVALRLALLLPLAVRRCIIDGQLREGLAGGVREGGTAAGGASAPPREPFVKPWGLLPRVDLGHESDFVPVDFIGRDRAIGAIPGLEDDDRDHQRGGERGGEGVCIFAGHLLSSCLGGEGPSPARQDPEGPKTG